MDRLPKITKPKSFFILSIFLTLLSSTRAGHDNGPGDPDFKENDGDLESAVNPKDVPKGNYHIVEEDDVYVLTRDNFAYFVKPKELVMVEFYAPWCGHCKTLEPEYAKAATELRKDDIPLAKVDASKEIELAKEHMVQGFPTLLLFRDGEKVADYEGERTAQDIVEYMRRQADPDWKPPPSAVMSLTMDNFTKTAKEKELMLVMFYAPWCKHCKQLEPEFEGAGQELVSWGITMAKVDGTREKELADQYQVAGWPTMKMFRKGRVYDYNGPREKGNIIQFMKNQKNPPSIEKASYEGIKKNLDRLESTVVGLFRGQSDLYEEFMVAANEMRGTYRFLHSENTEVAQQFNIPPDSVMVVQPEIYWSEYENKTFTMTKKSGTYKEILQFVRKNSIPLVGQRRRSNLMFKYTERPLIVIYYDVNFDHQYVKDTQFIRKKILSVARNFKDSNLRFAISNEDEFSDELAALGLDDSGADVNVACYSEKQKFRMEPVDDFESEDLAKFIENLRAGKVKSYLRSQPVPKRQESHILKIVANNYDQEIHKAKKDAVVFFYAPWCGHCKAFDPVLKKVAKSILKTNENIVFGKFDATVNDIPYMFPQLKGYPSLFFISAYDKYEPVLFQGDRSFKAVKDWINRHTSIFLTEEESTGEAVSDDIETPEPTEEAPRRSIPEEMESFQNEKFEETFKKQEDDSQRTEESLPKDEL